ncbi:hypothetical protein M569_10171 [Genlisea aurea]|uniref:Uncharacterized protein n=1 Tax=Genlisea aurea TaxID=192259 RepID=S8DXB2_9LAMI|nr:hypothetical protein M569_10171 [Genlisea aurea]
MERDFMGLNSKRPVCVKEESVEGSREDSGFARSSSGLPWLSENKMAVISISALATPAICNYFQRITVFSMTHIPV